MKIAIIASKLNLETGGGSNQSLHLVASQLVSLGHRVMLIALCPALNAYPEDLPYPVIAEGSLLNVLDRQYGLALRRILRRYENEVDIYHLWSTRYILDAAVYRRLGGKIPVVAYLNGYSFCTKLDLMNGECFKRCGIISKVWHKPENPLRKTLMLPSRAFESCLRTLMINQVDAFTAVSPAVAEIYSWQNIDRRKLFVAPAGIDYAHLCSLKQNHTLKHISMDGYNILYAGRLTPEKGVDILIRAISRLKFPLSLHIVGDGPQKSHLAQLCGELGASQQIFFHNWVPYDKLIEFYLGSQLLVHPVRWPEPLSRSLLDAMALGVPVIAADSGGSPWALQDTGLLFRPGDTNDLVDKIKLLHGNPSLAADLVRRAKERAKDFDYKKTIPRYIEVYRTTIEGATESRA